MRSLILSVGALVLAPLQSALAGTPEPEPEPEFTDELRMRVRSGAPAHEQVV